MLEPHGQDGHACPAVLSENETKQDAGRRSLNVPSPHEIPTCFLFHVFQTHPRGQGQFSGLLTAQALLSHTELPVLSRGRANLQVGICHAENPLAKCAFLETARDTAPVRCVSEGHVLSF